MAHTQPRLVCNIICSRSVRLTHLDQGLMFVFRRSDHSPHPKADRHSPQHRAEGQDGPQAAHPGGSEGVGFIQYRVQSVRPVNVQLPKRLLSVNHRKQLQWCALGCFFFGLKRPTFSIYRPPLDWNVSCRCYNFHLLYTINK